MNNELVETSAPTEIAEDIAQTELATPDATDGAEKPAEPAKTPDQLEIERLKRELSHKERALTKRDRTQGKLHQEREQLSQELERLRQQPAQQPDPATKERTDLRQVVEREAMTLAEQIADQKAFAAKCNSVAESGKKEFKDFPDALHALIEEAGPLVRDDGKTPTSLGEQILEADDPAKLIHYLGKNPEIAAELDGLTPGRIARKLAVIEQQMTAKPKTSSAPKPLEPTKGSASASNDLSDEVPLDEWLRRRNKQVQAKR